MSALRDQIGAAQAQLWKGMEMLAEVTRALDGRPPTPAREDCPHPPERRLRMARMGHPEGWRCECGTEGDG